jgi:hypothetical protein
MFEWKSQTLPLEKLFAKALVWQQGQRQHLGKF